MPRRYDPFVVAEVEATGTTSRDRFKTAFQRILAYVQGKNRSMGEDGKWQGRPERLDMSGMMTDRLDDTQGAPNKVDKPPSLNYCYPPHITLCPSANQYVFHFRLFPAYLSFKTSPRLACAPATFLFPVASSTQCVASEQCLLQVGFVLPKGRSLESLPRPEDKGVRLREFPGGEFRQPVHSRMHPLKGACVRLYANESRAGIYVTRSRLIPGPEP
jgi:hypothetical protein